MTKIKIISWYPPGPKPSLQPKFQLGHGASAREREGIGAGNGCEFFSNPVSQNAFRAAGPGSVGAWSLRLIRNARRSITRAIDQSPSTPASAWQMPKRCPSRMAHSILFDIVASGLALNFIPDPVRALLEMLRVTGSAGSVAGYVWDFAAELSPTWPLPPPRIAPSGRLRC
jgi:hypothetical protein